MLVCPSCGAHHAVPGGVARKVERGRRPGYCERCIDEGRLWLRVARRQPLGEGERERLLGWWFERSSDDELAAICSGLNGHDVSASGVARVRAAVRQKCDA